MEKGKLSLLSKDKLWNKIKKYLYYIIIFLIFLIVLILYNVILTQRLHDKISFIAAS
jgi:hypothetical protein